MATLAVPIDDGTTMGNSFAVMIQATCSGCGASLEAEAWLIVDTTERPDLKTLILNGTLHDVVCPTCGQTVGRANAPLLLYRPDETPTILFSPEDSMTAEHNQQRAVELVGQLRAWLGTDWRDEWLAEGLPSVRRAMLAMALSDNSATGLQEIQVEAPLEMSEFFGALRRAQAAEERYLRVSDRATLDESAAAWERVMSHSAFAAAPNHFRAVVCNEAGRVRLRRYWVCGHLEDLDRALELCQQAVATTDAHSPDRPVFLNNLGNVQRDRYTQSGRIEDLEAAIDAYQQTAAATGAGSPDLPMYYNNLALGLRTRHAHSGRLEDLEWAIEAWEHALAATVADSPDRPVILNSLGTGLSARYARGGRIEDLEAAIAFCRQALAAAGGDLPDRPMYLSNLGSGLRDRYARRGRIEDLEAAIDAWERAVATTPADSPDRPVFLNNLGNGLRDRYVRGGRIEDLEAAIDVWKQAVAATPANSPDRPARLNNLGLGLHDRYARSDRLGDLEAAIDVYQQAVAATGAHSPERPGYLSNVGLGLSARYARRGRTEDLEAAIATHQQVVAATDSESPYRAAYLNNLGIGLSDRYESGGQLADLEAAINAYQQALAVTGTDSPARPMYLSNLGTELRHRYICSGWIEDLRAATQMYEAACQGGLEHMLEIALDAARTWGRWAVARRAWDEAARAFGYGRQAIERLYQVQLLRGSRESWLREARGLHALAAYALARLDQGREAAIAFEEGRARGLGETLARDRAGLEQVQAQDPAAYDLYRQAAGRLRALEGRERLVRTGGAGAESALSPAVFTEEIRGARAELNQALARIRQLPGYERFLLAPTFGEMVRAVVPGCPLVYLATTEVGTLALVLHREPAAPDAEEDVQVEAVWADAFSEADLEELLVRRQGDELTGGYLPGQMFHGGWLQTALDEALPQLGEYLLGPPAGRLRGLGVSRVVLAPTGQLGLLPLHAARYVVDGREMCLLDEFEVGYVPSARVLGEAQREERVRRGHRRHLVGVGNPLKNRNPLAYARPELEEVAALFGEDVSPVLYEREATKERLMATLSGATHVHLSCHGMFDPDEPLNSHLQLANEEPWTLREILGAEYLSQARLVLLSACQTAITDFQNLPDEVIGLPAGFLQAGVPGVVGTLWPVNDLSTMLLMVRFYRYHLRGDEATGEGPMAPAAALRRAQLWLRDVTCGEL